MLSIIFKYFFLIYCSTYCFYKLLNMYSKSTFNHITISILSLCFSLMISQLKCTNISFRIILCFIIYFIFIAFSSKTKLSISFSGAIISFSISYIMFSMSSLFLSIIVAPIDKIYSNFPSNSFILVNGFLQYILICILFKTKRLQKGMPFIFNSSTTGYGILLSFIIIIFFIILPQLNTLPFSIHLFALILASFLPFLLLFWWRRRITLDYVQKLRMDEVESLYKRIADNEQEIEKLNTNNDYLSKVIHKDNKLIPAMEMALHSYLLEAPTMEAEEARQFGADLLSQLQSMSAEREGIISNYQKNTDSHPKIGIYSVDAVILYMEKRAEKFNITYNLRFDNDIKDAIVGFIHERDMLHLLSDLIENAIIAVKDASHREIFLHIGFLQGCLFIDLYDSGIPFEPAVYQDFGNCQHTTHADSGGSGIGLMDIWNLKRKYKASLQIYEYLPDSDIYTKKIRLLFDRRNHFLLQTYRDKEIRSFITRSDLHVFPLKEMKKKDKE